jgi:hypothetical protein
MDAKDTSTIHASRWMSVTTFLMIGILTSGTLFVLTLALNQNHAAMAQKTNLKSE